MIERVLPHDVEAEKSLLSAVLINNQELGKCSELDVAEFYSPVHQKIWSVCVALVSRQQPVDLVTVASELKNRGELDGIGGAGYLAELIDFAPMAINTAAYAEIVSDMAIKRSIISLAQDIYDRSFKRNCATQELISYVQSGAMQLQQGKRGDLICDLQELIASHIAQIIRSNATAQDRGFLLGFPRIDKILRLSGPKLVVVAGRPSMGKTAFAVTCSRNLAHLGVSVGFLSIEMSREEIVNRWLSMETGINSMKFDMYQGLDDRGLRDVTDAAEMMREWPIQIDDSGGLRVEDVERKCRKMVKNGAQCLFIDQLSKIKGRTGDQYKDYTVNCNRIADLKKELGVPIFLLAQINRGVTQRADKRPTLSDLKQTGALEEDADIVLLLHRPEYYEVEEAKKSQISGQAEINVAKNRNGAVFLDTQIVFNYSRSMFYQGGRNED